jgi:hypothetical protein
MPEDEECEECWSRDHEVEVYNPRTDEYRDVCELCKDKLLNEGWIMA